MLEHGSKITNRSIEFVKDNLKYIGKPLIVTHKRNKQEIYYETTIEGTLDSIVINGGLGSGYGGEGPRGFVKVLTFLGVPEEQAIDLVMKNTEDEHEFSINL